MDKIGCVAQAMITTTDISAATEKKKPTYKISKNKKKMSWLSLFYTSYHMKTYPIKNENFNQLLNCQVVSFFTAANV